MSKAVGAEVGRRRSGRERGSLVSGASLCGGISLSAAELAYVRRN